MECKWCENQCNLGIPSHKALFQAFAYKGSRNLLVLYNSIYASKSIFKMKTISEEQKWLCTAVSKKQILEDLKCFCYIPNIVSLHRPVIQIYDWLTVL